MPLSLNVLPSRLAKRLSAPLPLLLPTSHTSYAQLHRSAEPPFSFRSAIRNPPKSPISTPRTPRTPESPHHFLESLCPKCGNPDPSTSTLPPKHLPTTKPQTQRKPCAGIGPACRQHCKCASRQTTVIETRPSSSTTNSSQAPLLASRRTSKPIYTRIQFDPCAKCAARKHALRRASSVFVKAWESSVGSLALGEQRRGKVQLGRSESLGLKGRCARSRLGRIKRNYCEKEGRESLLIVEEWNAMMDEEE